MNKNHAQIRRLLRENKSGLSLWQLSELLCKPREAIRASIQRMPDIYIDRWIDISRLENGETRGGTPWSPVFCAADIPDDAPMPGRRKDY